MKQQRLVIGSGRFVPARMKIARQARMLKQTELAERLECSSATISKWEGDAYGHSPDSDFVTKLAAELGVSTAWFFKPYSENGRASFFRSLRSELVRSRDKIEARLTFLESIGDALQPFVEFPQLDLPDFDDFPDFREFRPEHIERFAIELREYWGLGDEPIDELLLLIENAGILVAEDIFESHKLDGISRWSSTGNPMMLLAKDKHIGVRRRFDAAHELGHLVMHRHVSSEELKDNFRLIEEQAMAFAGALLLPASSFVECIFDTSLDCLADVKPRWKVSIGAMVKRLSNLNIISEEYEKNLWKYYSYRNWRGKEPYDDLIAVESPENISSALTLLFNEDITSLRSVVEDTGLLASDIAQLSGVDERILQISAPVRRKIHLRESPSDDTGDNVVLFPGRRN